MLIVFVVFTLIINIINPSVGHVITGDVDIVKNNKLRKLFKKDYTYIKPDYKNNFAIFGSVKNPNYIDIFINIHSNGNSFFRSWRRRRSRSWSRKRRKRRKRRERRKRR